MDALKSMLSPLGVGSANAIQDTLVRLRASFRKRKYTDIRFSLQKLVVIGGTVETARRASAGAWHTFLDCTGHFRA
jgi:chaperone BCS1